MFGPSVTSANVVRRICSALEPTFSLVATADVMPQIESRIRNHSGILVDPPHAEHREPGRELDSGEGCEEAFVLPEGVLDASTPVVGDESEEIPIVGQFGPG